ncbi:TonB family protein [Flavilitoribacter nigricans]|uniref:TonB C-terminal domain-containing protein n=1 Tax=Flavilitoribacter nigricans (strain ATCC 23147 / DSM 23189 / NBRC 102662 / NCIMB 1420 / SS-2) TaxID=1122177 RepID=A0A2D0NGN1_FLAN2|nr:TonB family protein [Flavilitoribacter nigricans]PHN07329.1 hypothetical protein CRP01_06780 [Flavilitoribacter nigricans DSM 23189 = NBRC 102662]
MIAYLLDVSLCWLTFYLLYYFWLSNETFFHLNRWYLLGTLVLGLIIPFVPSPFGMQVQESEWVTLYVAPLNMGLESLEVTVTAPGAAEQHFDWMLLLKWIYWGGVFLTAFRFLSGIWRISTLYLRAEHIRVGQYRVALTDEPHLPFSFFRVVFKSKLGNLDEFAEEKITDHELAHVRGWHTIDVLLVELVSIFLWCSPPVYLYRRSLRIVHEYIADSAAIRTGEKKKYGHLLIRQSQSGLQLALANHFIQSQLKKRIMMMTKTRSRRQAFLKYLPVIPLLVVAMVVFSNWEAVANDSLDLLGNSPSNERVTENATLNEDFDPKVLEKKMRAILDKAKKLEADGEGTQEEQYLIDQFAVLHENWSQKYPEHRSNILQVTKKVAEEFRLFLVIEDGQIQKAFDRYGVQLFTRGQRVEMPASFKETGSIKLNGDGNPYVLINEKPAPADWKETLDKSNIESVNVLKGESAIKAYGEKAKDGAVLIYTKDFEKEIQLKGEGEPYVLINDQPAPADWKSSIDKENIAKVNVLKGEAAIAAYGEKAKDGAIQIYTKDFKKANNETDNQYKEAPSAKVIISKLGHAPVDPLFILDGEVFEGDINDLDPNDIEMIDVLKGESAIKEFGEAGANGVVRISTKDRPYDVSPIFPGCEDLEGEDQLNCSRKGFLMNVYKNIRYPASARNAHIEGMIVVKYTIGTDGKVKNAMIHRGIDEALDNEVLRVINELPDWKPALKDGKPVAVDMILPVQFNIEGDEEESRAAKKAIGNENYKESKRAYLEKMAIDGQVAEEIVVTGYGQTRSPLEAFKIAEEMPRFPGCEGVDVAERQNCADKNMIDFIYKNVTYTEAAKKAGTSGTVVVSFVVGKNGKIRDVRILKGLGHGLNESVLNMIDKMPDWIPGRQDGKLVDVIFNLPVRFKTTSVERPATTVKVNGPDQQPATTMLDLKNFKAAPNPTNGLINLRFQAEAQPLQVRVLTAQGQAVYQRNIPQFNGNFDEQIDLSDAPKGTLFISVQQGEKMYTSTVIVQ